ncbi:hypothetical protein FGG08_001490 [Glutinoglossum americanum]|uniref:Uncharacterized protein n=1 Tax=Glutinoglossum americanum TaxID=1670608 RepID=A0A9P8L596_9PEZI|nr:hypothetical protein FGG08_001490 [Glutinoglossum americanum]
MAFPTIFHEDSDADDEYERSVTSPQLPTDSEASPTDSDPPSAEHTPTTYGNFGDERLPKGTMTDWTVEDCAEYISGLGLQQYYKAFIDNSIVGEALVALRHDELKEMGIISAGHRLTVLKNIYDVKIKQDIQIEPEHYIPLSADVGHRDSIATQEDIARIIQSIKIRDERIIQAEAELKKVTEDYRRLREELLPVFRMAKEMSQPLPQIGDPNSEQAHNYDQAGVTSPPQQPVNGISRKYSTKTPGTQPKNSSPTHIPLSNQDSKLVDTSNLDPSAAVVAASSHLTAFVSGGGSQPSSTPHQPNMPSPTSPHAHSSQSTLPPRSYPRDPSSSTRSLLSNADDSTITPNYYASSNTTTPVERERSNPTPTSSRPRQEEPPGSAGAPTVEIFKSFRVSMDDPCYKVLPAALKKYQINADWRQYALYIVYGDQERCLDLQERPLILFKQLDREGKKPMFMLRRHQDGHTTSAGLSPGSASLESGQQTSSMGGRGQAYQSGVDLPGGVL